MVMAKIVLCQIIGTTLSIMKMEYSLIKFAGDVNDIRNIGKVSKKKKSEDFFGVSTQQFIIAHHSLFRFQRMKSTFFIRNENTYELSYNLRYFYRGA